MTAAYNYDGRDRCTQVQHNGAVLADYTWLGNALSRRDTTCDYPGSTKPKFKGDFQRDGILRVTKLVNEHLTADQAGSTYGKLGTWDYTYDAASNEISGVQASGMQQLTAGATHDYDTASRLITTRNTDTQNWTGASAKTSWYTYDDLGNRISHKHRTDSAIGYAHDKANRMTTIANKTQSYDKAGNVTVAYSADRGTSYTYRWDHHNRLTGVYDSTNTTRKAAFTWDALGRRVEFINDKLGTTTRYYYDGVNEIVEDDQSAARQRYYVHGVSYIDERLMMYRDANSRPYYYVIDRMYNVRMLVDRAGAIVERIAYDGYGQPYIRESAGRGDMNDDTQITSTDSTRMGNAVSASIWDPRADLDDDGDVDSTDQTLFDTKRPTWDPADVDFPSPTVAQAFSDVDNPFMFQGVPHFALDTAAADTAGKLMLNHHRNRWVPPPEGRWVSRDPLVYNGGTLYQRPSNRRLMPRTLQRIQAGISAPQLFGYLREQPLRGRDPAGTTTGDGEYGSYTCYPDGNNEDGTGPAEILQVFIPPGCEHDCANTHENEHRTYGYPTCYAFWLFRSDPYYSYAFGCLDTAYQIWGILHEHDDECSAATVSAGCSCTDPTCSCPQNGIHSPLCLANLANIAANCPNGGPTTFPPPSPPWDSILTCLERH